MSTNSPACKAAEAKHDLTIRWLNVWTGLLFFTGCVLVLFVVAAIVLILLGKMPGGAVAAVGALIAGGALPWVVERQREAHNDEKEALQEVNTYCGSTAAAEARRDRSRLRIFGVKI